MRVYTESLGAPTSRWEVADRQSILCLLTSRVHSFVLYSEPHLFVYVYKICNIQQKSTHVALIFKQIILHENPQSKLNPLRHIVTKTESRRIQIDIQTRLVFKESTGVSSTIYTKTNHFTLQCANI